MVKPKIKPGVPPKITVEFLQQKLIELDKGVLKLGAHSAGRGEFCALEFSHAVRGHSHSDAPGDLPDIRPLNDAFGDNDKARTKALLPVMVALWDWQEWSTRRKQRWGGLVAIWLTNRIVAELPGLPDKIRVECRTAKTLAAAAVAAAAAAVAAAAAARYAAADVAAAAAAAARYAAAAAAADVAAAAAAAAAARYAAADVAAAAAADVAAAAAADVARFKALDIGCKILVEAVKETENL